MKHPDYINRLIACIEEAAKKPFDYGGFNCGLFAAECIDAQVINSTRVEELRAQFTDEASAKAFVATAGSMEAAVTARLGEPSSNWATAVRGSVCLMPTQDGPGLGVCMGVQVAMMTPGVGLTNMKIDQALKIWRID